MCLVMETPAKLKKAMEKTMRESRPQRVPEFDIWVKASKEHVKVENGFYFIFVFAFTDPLLYLLTTTCKIVPVVYYSIYLIFLFLPPGASFSLCFVV